MAQTCLLEQLFESANQAHNQERRHAPRTSLPQEATLEMRFPDGRIMCVKVLNVSATGLEFECGEHLQVADRVQLRMAGSNAECDFEPFQIARIEPRKGGVWQVGAQRTG